MPGFSRKNYWPHIMVVPDHLKEVAKESGIRVVLSSEDMDIDDDEWYSNA